MNLDTVLCVGLVAIAAVMIGRMCLAVRRQRLQFEARAAEIMQEHDATPPRPRNVRRVAIHPELAPCARCPSNAPRVVIEANRGLCALCAQLSGARLVRWG
jgi:hypothetical protein